MHFCGHTYNLLRAHPEAVVARDTHHHTSHHHRVPARRRPRQAHSRCRRVGDTRTHETRPPVAVHVSTCPQCQCCQVTSWTGCPPCPAHPSSSTTITITTTTTPWYHHTCDHCTAPRSRTCGLQWSRGTYTSTSTTAPCPHPGAMPCTDAVTQLCARDDVDVVVVTAGDDVFSHGAARDGQ